MAAKIISLSDGLDEAVNAAVASLRESGVIVFPTETVYGIGVTAGDPIAYAKLRCLKQRPDGKPFQYLCADVQMAEGLGAVFSEQCLRLAENFWPGPLTMVVPDGTEEGSLGIRIPDSSFMLALCRKLEKPIIASSANVSGKRVPQDAATADTFGNAVCLLVDGGATTEGVPSTVVRCLDNQCEILRAGGIKSEAIKAVWSGEK